MQNSMYVSVENIRFYISDGFDNEHPDRPPLILLHGFTGSTKDWSPFFKTFQRKFQPIAIDLIGHGQTDSPENLEYYSMNAVVKQLHQILKQLRIESAHWLGYSMGGRTALSFALKYPGRVQSLVLESATPGISNPQERKIRQQVDDQLAKFIEDHTIEEFVDQWLDHPIFETQKNLPQQRREQSRQMRLQNSRSGLANTLRGFGTGHMPHLWDSLDHLSVQTLLITGKKDKKFTTIAQRMKKLLPNVAHEVVEDAGHNIHFERPEIFAEITTDFLEQQLASEQS